MPIEDRTISFMEEELETPMAPHTAPDRMIDIKQGAIAALPETPPEIRRMSSIKPELARPRPQKKLPMVKVGGKSRRMTQEEFDTVSQLSKVGQAVSDVDRRALGPQLRKLSPGLLDLPPGVDIPGFQQEAKKGKPKFAFEREAAQVMSPEELRQAQKAFSPTDVEGLQAPGPPGLERPGTFRSNVGAFLRPVLDMVPQTIEGTVELMDFLGNIGVSEEEARATALAPKVRPYTRAASSAIRGALPTNEGLTEDVLGAFGSATGFVGGGLAGRALKIPGLVTSAMLGAGINVADTLREADAMGIDPKRRNAALLMATGAGLTEIAGLGRALDKFGLSKTFYRRLFEVAEEGGQEGLQEWLGNINAAYVGGYDPNRPGSEGVLKAAILGGIVGTGFQGVSTVAERRAQGRLKRDFDRDFGISDPSQIKILDTQTPIQRAVGPSPFAGEPKSEFPLTELIKSRRRPTEEVLAGTDPVTGLPLYTPPKVPTDTSPEKWMEDQAIIPGAQPRIADDPFLQEIESLQASALDKMGLTMKPEEALDIVNLYEESILAPLPFKATQYQKAWNQMSKLSTQELGAMSEYGKPLRSAQFPSRPATGGQAPGDIFSNVMTAPPQTMESPQGPLPIKVNRAKGVTLTVGGTRVERPGSLSREYGATHYPYATDLRLPGPGTNTDEVAISWETDEPLYENMLQIGRINNPLMELRFQDREMSEGGKGTFLIEAQSSWAQDRNKKQTNPLRNQWTTRALEFMVEEAKSRGTDGVLIPTTPEQIYQIQNYGPVQQDAEGNYINSDGTNVSPIIRRYQKEFPELVAKLARKMGVTPQKRRVVTDEYTGETTELLFLPTSAMTLKNIGDSQRDKNRLRKLINDLSAEFWALDGDMEAEPDPIKRGKLFDRQREIRAQMLATERELAQFEEDLESSFELIPSPIPGKAPLLIAPDWVLRAVTGGGRLTSNGVNTSILHLPDITNRLANLAPSEALRVEALDYIAQLQEQSAAQGLTNLSFMNNESHQPLAKLVPHETFHAGQGKAAVTVGERKRAEIELAIREGRVPDYGRDMYDTVLNLHDEAWATAHPFLNKVIQVSEIGKLVAQGTQPGINPYDVLAVEMPAYTMAGELDRFTLQGDPNSPAFTTAEGIDYLFDYFNHLMTRHGPDILDDIAQVAWLRPEVSEAMDLARSMYESWQQERTVESGFDPGTSKPTSSSPSLQGPTTTRNISRGGEGQAPAAGGKADIPSAIRQENLSSFLVGSTVQTPVYHGTDADFDTFEKMGDIGFHFGSTPQAAEDRIGTIDYVEKWPDKVDRTTIPGGRVGQYYINLKNPLRVTDSFISNNPEATAQVLLGDGHIQNNQNLDSLMSFYRRSDKGGDIDPSKRPLLAKKIQEEVIRQLEEKGYDGFVYTNLSEGVGTDSYSVFRPTQIKSVWNKGTFDPNQPNAFLNVMDDAPKVGDKVRPKGYSSDATVVGPGEETDTLKVRFKGGAVDEFPIDELTMVSEGPISNPPPPQGPNTVEYEEIKRDPLFVEKVNNTYNKRITEAFIRLLDLGGVEYDPLVRPFLQVGQAIANGKLRDGAVEAVLAESELSWDDFKAAVEDTASEAGRTLQYYSRIEKIWEQMLTDQPALAEKLVPLRYRIRKAMEGMDNSILGRSVWERSGGLIQKMLLSQLSTFAVNTWTATGQLPIRMASQGLGAWMQQVAEGKGNLAERIKKANRGALEAANASLDVTLALNPRQLQDILQEGKGKEYQYYHSVVQQLEKAFPDLHRKLFALSMGPETLASGQDQFKIAQALVPRVKDKAKRQELLKQLKGYEKRVNSNVKGLGKILSKPEVAYDFFLKPMQFAEYMFRRPMFVGQLRLELGREGHDLNDILFRNALSEVPKEAVERAVNRALEFTYAYMPSDHKDAPKIERAAAAAIKAVNKWGGPINALVGEPFLKAMYNGMKFLYEYSPIGGLNPLGRIVRNIIKPRTILDPVTGEVIVHGQTTQKDWDRLAQAMIGTLMYAAADGLLKGAGGDEWWQIKTGRKSEDGRPIYWDIRRYHPFSDMVHLADLVRRLREGRQPSQSIGGKDFAGELLEITTGLRRVDNQTGMMDYLNAMKDYWGGEELGAREFSFEEEIGRKFAIPLTPLLNLRDAIAQYSEQENIKRETRGEGVLGPVIDRIPWLRQTLPPLTSPTEPSPIKIAEDPMGAQWMGYREAAGENFAGREWRRLGLLNKKFIPRDPDPTINREQNRIFQEVIAQVGESLESDPNYTQSDDKTKAAIWDRLISGDRGIAAKVRKLAEIANPEEMIQRKAKKRMPPPLQRRALGLDEILKQLKGQ